MNKKTAFITGVAGQDGSYLSEYLLSLGYEVHGIIRRASVPEHQVTRIENLNIKTYYGDVLDTGSLQRLLFDIQPDEIYNLAAQSHVRISFENPQLTAHTNAIGVLNILEAYRLACPGARFYQASSSEMFGNSIDPDGYQRETTPMRPVSPYGCAKLYAYNIVKTYRDSYGLHASNGILFNHESPRRGSNFVTNKVVKGAVRIKLGLQESITLGNLYSRRDWGHSKDYVRAMHLILQQGKPSDIVVATGKNYSVLDMVRYVFANLDIPTRFINTDNKYRRPNELNELKGDATNITNLGWHPEYTFEMLMDEMIDCWIKFYT